MKILSNIEFVFKNIDENVNASKYAGMRRHWGRIYSYYAEFLQELEKAKTLPTLDIVANKTARGNNILIRTEDQKPLIYAASCVNFDFITAAEIKTAALVLAFKTKEAEIKRCN